MSTVNDTDLLLVERNGTQYQITIDEMSTLNDDDLLLVERGGVQYKIEAQYVSTGPDGLILPPVEVLTPVNGAGLNDGDPYTPLSSAYVSTDTTPITYHYFPELITTVSGGSWVNENNLFDGNSSNYAELTGAAYAVSQVVFTPHASWSDGDTTVWAYGEAGGVIEILDNTDTVLRTYPISTNNGNTSGTNRYEVGIVRTDQKIRFTTNGQNESLYISRINLAPTDYVITGRVAFEFTDDTDLDKMVAPIIMTDENGDVKVPTTSTVDSTTTIPGEDKFTGYTYTGNGQSKTFHQSSGAPAPPVGNRMVWGKVDGAGTGYISDNVALYSKYLLTAEFAGEQSYFGPELDENQSRYPSGSAYINLNGKQNYIAEIGVAPKVLDIIEYTGNTSGPREIQHNLGQKPGMIIIKNIDSNGYSWFVWHKDLTSGRNLSLNQSDGETANSLFPSEPTSDAFYIGASSSVNQGNDRYVAYVFAAETPGKVYCGKYTGNGSSGGQNISIEGATEAGFLLIKRKDSNNNWIAVTKQTQAIQKYWYPNSSSSFAGNASYYVGFLSGGGFFVLGGDSDYNGSGGEYVYLYVANELTGPNSTQLNLLGNQDLEYFTDGTEITSNLAASGSNIAFGTVNYTGNGTNKIIQPITDDTFFDTSFGSANKWMFWIKSTSYSVGHAMIDSERNRQQALDSSLSYADNGGITEYYLEPFYDRGYQVGNGSKVNLNGTNYISWNFLGAPQFFDVQKYIGNSGANAIPHDLGVEPGCILIKNISDSADWWVYHSEMSNNQYLRLNRSNAASYSAGWMATTTDSHFVMNSSQFHVNGAGGTYVSYLFAKDTPYVKCGSYTGTGDNQEVNVGFRPRWMMIKRTNADANWFIIDKSLPSKYMEPNGTGGEGSFGWGFNTTGVVFFDSNNMVNGIGGSYIYVAIADESEGHPPFPPSSTTVQGTPDVNAATMVVNAESFDVGDSASAPALEASITAVGGTEGNNLLVDSSTGTWLPGLYAKGSETTVSAPSPDEITFTARNASTTPFSGVDATLSSRTWTLESGPSATGPWTVVDTYVDYDALASQDGATPWSTNKPALTADTFYRVKVQYDSTNAESVESVYHTFKTGAS